jgi:hypothetical protein
MADRCSFCGSTAGPFSTVEGLFTVLMCADCQATRGHGSGPYPVMTRAEMRAGLDLMATWALEQKAPPTASSSRPCAYDWLPASRWPACTRSWGWPGWSAKPRSPKSWWRSGSELRKTAQDHDHTDRETRTPQRPSPASEVRGL